METSLAYLKRLNAFVYENKSRLLKKNKKAEKMIVEIVRYLSKEQQKETFQNRINFFMEVSWVLDDNRVNKKKLCLHFFY